MDRPLQAMAMAMMLQVTEALTAMAGEAMVVVRATVKIAVASAVRAKEVTTLWGWRGRCSVSSARWVWRARRSHCACASAAPVQQRMRQFRNDEWRMCGGLTDHRTASVMSRFTRALEVRAQIFAGFDARNSPGSERRAVSTLIDCTGSRRHPSNGWRAIP